MDRSTTTTQPAHQPPPPQNIKDIEVASRRAREAYHLPDNVYLIAFDSPCVDPRIARQMRELYADRDQTQRHYEIFFSAKSNIQPTEFDGDRLPLDNRVCELDAMYGRLMKLYESNLLNIQEMGTKRISLWTQWYQEITKPDGARNDVFTAACISTLHFLVEDFQKRKLDFVTEVYALLEKRDPERAKMVLDDLQAIWPWAQINQIKFLEEYTVDYSHIPRRKHHVVRNSNWEAHRYAKVSIYISDTELIICS